MKYVGVSTPAWTIVERHEKPEQQKPNTDMQEIAIIDSDALSKKHLYPRAPTTVIVLPSIKNKNQGYEEETQEETPPPTEIARKVKKGPSTFSKDDRFKMKNFAMGPGPTSYQQDLSKSIAATMPNFNFGYRWDTSTEQVIKDPIDPEHPEKTPGFYKPMYIHKEFSRKVTIPKAQKEGLNLLTGSSAPGPGFYKIIGMKGNTSSVKGTFSGAKRQGLYASSPDNSPKQDSSPNQFARDYKADVIRRDPPKKTLPRVTSEKKLTERIDLDPIPMVASTANIFKSSGPKWGFGTGKRPNLNGSSQTELGPGQYWNETFSKKENFQSPPKFPRAERRPLNDNSDTPGPGTYPLIPTEEDEIGKKALQKSSSLGGPSFSFRGKFAPSGSKDYYNQPGPGKYDFEDYYRVGVFRGKGVKFGTSSRPKEDASPNRVVKDEVPGPGYYFVNRDLGSEQGIKFPKSKRLPISTTDPDVEIGPGHYNLKPVVPDLQPFEAARVAQNESLNLNF